jgi:hypothetical protein
VIFVFFIRSSIHPRALPKRLRRLLEPTLASRRTVSSRFLSRLVLDMASAEQSRDMKRIVKALLNSTPHVFGGSPSRCSFEAAIVLFRLLVAALIFNARIRHGIALKSARVLLRRGWTTPEKMAATTWKQRVKALGEGGYLGYDERTSTMLGATAQMIIDRYGGDLPRLPEASDITSQC